MSTQAAPIRKQCQSRTQCDREAVWGLYVWKQGETDVRLDTPVRVYCGLHKPKPGPRVTQRLVRLAR